MSLNRCVERCFCLIVFYCQILLFNLKLKYSFTYLPWCVVATNFFLYISVHLSYLPYLWWKVGIIFMYIWLINETSKFFDIIIDGFFLQNIFNTAAFAWIKPVSVLKCISNKRNYVWLTPRCCLFINKLLRWRIDQKIWIHFLDYLFLFRSLIESNLIVTTEKPTILKVFLIHPIASVRHL